jgi:hypothetical protein
MNDTTATPAAASILVAFSAEQGTEVCSRKRSRALPEQSSLELMIANMLPLRDKGGRPVICCLDFGINYYERQGK